MSTPNVMNGVPVIKGTRIPLEIIFYQLKDGYPLESIHYMYRWVDMHVLEGAINEAIQAITTAFHANKVS